jgi:hypothetical protein
VSIEPIANEIRRFLSTTEPEVTCISGHWGVGKTFAWNRYLQEAQKAKSIALKRYSYISLFGVNLLDEFKYSVFENSVNCSDVGVEPSLETLQKNTAAAAERFGRKSLWFLQQIPLIKNYVGGLGPVWFLSVRDTIICVDDIQRRGLRLRAAMWWQWKTPRRRRAALLDLGVRARLASNTAGSGLGPWYLAKAKALSVGLSNAYFKSLGLPSLIEEVSA